MAVLFYRDPATGNPIPLFGSSTGTGSGSGGYTHIQSALSAEWTVQHNLGRHPLVQAEDSVGTLIFGTVQHLDDNTLRIMYAIAVTGRATCT